MERQLTFADSRKRGVVSLSSPLLRYPDNPILTPHEVNAVWREPHLQVVTVHNAGVTRMGDQIVMLFRSHLRSGLSVIGLARSRDGLAGWDISPRPVLKPATPRDHFAPAVDRDRLIALESGGVEDPRVNPVDDTFAITYSAYDAAVKNRVRVALATTRDFTQFVRQGPVLDQDMRNVVIFPERIHGRYIGLFRPNDANDHDRGGVYTQIHIGYADDVCAGQWQIEPQPIMRTGRGPSAFSDKIGPGAPPVRTPHGWISIFHGVRTTMDGNPYVLGVALHDLDDPSRVQMSSIPILFPSAADCRVGETDYVHVPHAVFSCGLIRHPDGTLVVYYGGNDTVMNVAITHEDILVELCRRYGQDPLIGRLLYQI